MRRTASMLAVVLALGSSALAQETADTTPAGPVSSGEGVSASLTAQELLS